MRTCTHPEVPIHFGNSPRKIHHRSTFRNTPVSRTNELPTQTSDAVKKGYSAGATCLGEFPPLQMNAHSSRETNTVESRKRKLRQTETSTKLDRKFGHNEAVLLQEPNHHNEAALLQEPNHHNEATLLQESIHNRATPSSVLLQGPNQDVWPSDLISILQRIAELPCRQPSKPLFAFEFNLEAANKNFILLKRKFGGDLSEALLAQSDSPLGY